jgi:hypothetical protein
MNAAKNKGKAFERDICHFLEPIFGVTFCRVPCSGSITGGVNSVRGKTLTQNQQLLLTGDIIMPSELDKFAIEAKFYKDFSFSSLFQNNKQLDGWINQARGTQKIWFLMFKVNGLGVHIVFDRKLEKVYEIPGNYMFYKDCIITYLDGFFEKNKDNILKLNVSQFTTTPTLSS